MNENIYFTMLTLLLSFCKCLFSRVYGKILVDYSFIKLCLLVFIHSCLVMPYSNQRRHNSPSITQTPYQTLIIPCPNIDPIYQVILLENSNEWNLSPGKEGSSKKRGARIEKKKGETLGEKIHVLRKEKKEMLKFTNCWERFYQKKERKEITISYSAKSNV
jgi:hypothetical protein